MEQTLRPPSAAALAWRQTLRDFRAGELRLLAVAVTLAVAALTAVGFFADRLSNGLQRDARQLLGGDAVVGSDRATPPALVAKAQQMGLQVAPSVVFPSMARAPDERGGATRLVAVKAVSPAYPLRGKLQLKDSPSAAVQTVAAAPAPGTVWVDASLLDALQIEVGDKLLLGDSALTVARLIVVEPDRGAGFTSFSPRVMLAEADLAATGLVQPASRLNYRLAVAAPPAMAGARGEAVVREYVAWVEQQIQAQTLRGLRVESIDSGRPEMQQTLDRAEKFLNLVALLAALLAAVAVGIAARDFASRHLDDCAMLRVLGLSQRRIATAYTLEFAFVGLLASVAGVLIGLLVHNVFVWLLAGLVSAALPPPGLGPALFGLGVGMTLLLGFGLPPVLQLAQVPPLRVIRRDVGSLNASSAGVLAAGALGFVALLMAVSSDLKLGAIAVGGFALAIGLFAVMSWGAVLLLKRSVPESRAPRWLVLATRQIAARPAFAVLQVSALAVGLLALMLLVLLRTDLIASWRQATPPDAPNRFVINIQPDQAEAFRGTLDGAGVKNYDWYPMIRGRLVAINGKPTKADDYADERAARLVEREFNLSHSAQAPAGNAVVAGRWVPDEAGGLSVEEGLAQQLGLKLGDTLRFDIAGQFREGRITSLRKVDWGSMRVNFFVMFPQGRMDDVPLTYISAFRAPAAAAPAAPASAPAGPNFDSRLSRDFPNITNVDVSASIAQVQRVLDQVVRAVEFLFGFTLVAGLVVLFSAISATREARSREFAIMRAMGAGGRLLAQVQRTELLGVGALAGLLASLVAMVLGWALAKFAFQFAWTPSPWVPLIGTAAGAVLALMAGWWGLREVLRRPVLETLRRAGAV
ncbi:ABC transporter permease [Rubrivivax rivuli]|uniref:FtsX-like permease family protein n=1 Tax=Rubrivivax rivuli TaxID=1862385 RepID=A0A437RC97_9BURK|nr:FtsX-like permease family protein [Rubrivivax rivuli]RVU44385.1 FtsX-like permease family protein [Rubrivivax rivuli]